MDEDESEHGPMPRQWPHADRDREWTEALRLALTLARAPKRLRDSVRRALTVEVQRETAKRLRSA